jgi:hypothetical protein
MKDLIEYKKIYKRDVSKENIDHSYNQLLRNIESISIPLEETHISKYLQLEEKFISKTEISYERIDEEIPYLVTAIVEKQGKDTQNKSEIEKILLKEGFKEIQKPIVQ